MSYDVIFLKEKLKNNLLGGHITYYRETESTNDDAFLLALQGAGEGVAVLADAQSKGKGRYARTWHSPPGKNIYLSIILRPPVALDETPRIPILAGVTAAETIEYFCAGRVFLKWPNDVLLDGKKICGILSQLKVVDEKTYFIVLGIGINVNIKADEFPHELKTSATSMFMQTGAFFKREDIIIIFFENLEKWYKKLLQNGFEEIKSAWLKKTDMVGKKVIINCSSDRISGRVQGIDDNGSLVLVNKQNETISVCAGDATLVKE